MPTIFGKSLTDVLTLLEGAVMQAASAVGLIALVESITGVSLTNSRVTMFLVFLGAALLTRTWKFRTNP